MLENIGQGNFNVSSSHICEFIHIALCTEALRNKLWHKSVFENTALYETAEKINACVCLNKCADGQRISEGL